MVVVKVLGIQKRLEYGRSPWHATRFAHRGDGQGQTDQKNGRALCGAGQWKIQTIAEGVCAETFVTHGRPECGEHGRLDVFPVEARRGGYRHQ